MEPREEHDDPRTFDVQGVLRSLGEAIAAGRMAFGWTQAELAAQAGVHLSSISRMEHGTFAQSVVSVLHLAHLLNLPLLVPDNVSPLHRDVLTLLPAASLTILEAIKVILLADTVRQTPRVSAQDGQARPHERVGA